MSSANIVAEIHQKLCHERTLSTGEPCTCEYVTLLQSFHRCTLSLSIHCVLFRRSFKTVMFSRFLKATLNFMKKVYNGGFAREFSVSMLTIVLVRNYVSETRKNNQNQPKNICENKYQSSFIGKFLVDLCDKVCRAHTVLPRSKTQENQNFLRKKFSVSLEKDFIFRFHILMPQKQLSSCFVVTTIVTIL